MDHFGTRQLVPEQGEERIEPSRSLVHHGHDGPGRDGYPVAVGQQLGYPLDRNVLADHEVADERPQVGSTAGGTSGLIGKCSRK